ncbi:iron(III) transport system substrate-binding protein [Nocardioides sp. J9]|uniref:ABC transporter substrate-binding protein n=1 Tax=Nocardioides sp. J9 TaxID=935844 RepID=UPI0011AC17E2|nr:extracellular solute-binding protein [Nocardioides sp. J9]TWG98553.1 iron(III) transport system substrate-binding protein [Nocardioides sp. J9]
MRSPSRITSAAVAFAAALATLGLSACGSDGSDPAEVADASDFDAVVEAANKEGKLSLYTNLAIGYEEVIAEFNKEYPDIEVEAFVGKDADILARVEQEQMSNAAGADVVWVSSSQFFKAQGDGVLHELTELPSAALWDGSPYFHDTYMQVLQFPAVLEYNKNVTDPPTDYPDLLDPKYKGKIGTVDPTLTPNLVAFNNYLKEKYGADYLEKLGELGIKFYDSGPSIEAALQSGEIDVAAYASALGAENGIRSGAPVAYNPAPETPVTNASAGALQSADHPNAALVWMNWILSKEGQDAMVATQPEGVFVSTLDTEAKVYLLKPEELSPEEWPKVGAEQKKEMGGN